MVSANCATMKPPSIASAAVPGLDGTAAAAPVARLMVLDGTRPASTQVPPISATRAPNSPAAIAAEKPAEPAPMTARIHPVGNTGASENFLATPKGKVLLEWFLRHRVPVLHTDKRSGNGGQNCGGRRLADPRRACCAIGLQ